MPVRHPGPGLPWLRIVVGGSALAALLVAVALMAAPSTDPAAAAAAERTAQARLRELLAAERQFASGAWIDTDGDGRGEFGFLAELGGGARLRIDAKGRLGIETLVEPLLPERFAAIVDSAVDDGSYVLQLHLPTDVGGWVEENTEGGGAGVHIAADAAEQHFRAYAWPTTGSAGQRAFSIEADGTLRAHANAERRFEDRDRRVPALALDQDPDAWRPLP